MPTKPQIKVGDMILEIDPDKIQEEYRWRSKMADRAKAGDAEAQAALDEYVAEIDRLNQKRFGHLPGFRGRHA